jgi:hypothetical protein
VSEHEGIVSAFTVQLPPADADELRRLAAEQRRDPRQQAALILLRSLRRRRQRRDLDKAAEA